MTQKTSKKLSATPIPSIEKYLYGVCVIVNKKLSPTFDAVNAQHWLGVTFGKRKGDRKTWWWNEKVQESIKEKKEAKKAWDKRDEKSKKIYKEKRSKAKKAVAMAKRRAYDV